MVLLFPRQEIIFYEIIGVFDTSIAECRGLPSTSIGQDSDTPTESLEDKHAKSVLTILLCSAVNSSEQLLSCSGFC